MMRNRSWLAGLASKIFPRRFAALKRAAGRRPKNSLRSFSDAPLATEKLEPRHLLTVSIGDSLFDEPIEPVAAQIDISGMWQSIIDPALVSNRGSSDSVSYLSLGDYASFALDQSVLDLRIDAAPSEAARGAGAVITLPTPEGEFQQFAFWDSPIMAPELAAQFPEIQTFIAQGIDDPAATARLDWTPQGFHAQVLSPEGAYYVDPFYHLQPDGPYVSYFLTDYLSDDEHAFVCLTEDVEVSNSNLLTASHEADHHTLDADHGALVSDCHDCQITIHETEEATSSGDSLTSLSGDVSAAYQYGNQLRTYDIAVATTGEYTAFQGGTISSGLAAVATTINRLNLVYETDVSVRLNLIAGNDLLIFTDGSSDPYTNNNLSAQLSENQLFLDFGVNNGYIPEYDIGHVFSTAAGGLASMASVGKPGYKARGASGLHPDNPWLNPEFIAVAGHEIGHQFGANHTFNAPHEYRNNDTAVEPGSGSTLMSYAGLLGAENLQSSMDSYYHAISILEIVNTITTGYGNAAATITNTGNNLPTVSAGPDYSIPARTPFYLTATGSDPDAGDDLTYGWEQINTGSPQSVYAGDDGDSPLFRSYPPTPDATRYFPRLEDVIDGSTVLGETMPTTTRDLDFVVTARDNRAGGGGTATDYMTVTVYDTGSAFAVTSPNSSVSWPANSTQTVSWNVAGTNAGSINASTIDIGLLTDAGFYTLATATANDGSHQITVPNTLTDFARIDIQPSNNIFYDISDVNFSIVAGSSNGAPIITNPGNQSDAEGDAVSLQMSGSDPDGHTLSWSASGLPAGLSINPTTGLITGTLAYEEAGSYSVHVSATDGDLSDAASFTWTITNNRAPAVINPGNQSDTEGDAVSLQMYGSDPDGDALSWSASGLPSSLSINTNTGRITGTLAYEEAGAYSVQVSATDGALTGTASFTWTIANNRAPTVTSPGNRSDTEGDAVSLQISGSDPDGDALSWSASGLPSSLSINTNTGRITGTLAYDSAGAYSVHVSATDGELSDAASFTWTITNNRAPAVTSPGNQSDTEGDAVSLQMSGSDPDGHTLSWSASGLPAGLSINTNTGLISGTLAYHSAGAYSAQVSATDGDLSDAASFTWTIANNRAPTVTNPGNQSDAEGDAVSLQMSGSDPDGHTLSWSASGLPAGLSINTTTGLITGTLAYDEAGSYSVHVSATDGDLSDAASFSWTIANTNRAPTVAAPGNQSDAEGDTVSLQLSASDPDGQTPTWSASGLPAGLSINPTTGLISGTLAYDEAGSYSVHVSATDGELSDATSFTWTIANTQEPMEITTYDVGNNLVSGGSFDNIPVSGRLWNQHRLGFVPSIPGWSSAHPIEVWGQSFLTRIFGERAGTEDRGQVLELDNEFHNGNRVRRRGVDWIQQRIATEQDVQYLILIDALGRTGNGESDDLQLRWNNSTFHTATTAEMRGQSWQTFGGLVTGTGGSNTLRISETAGGNDGVGPLIDNVRAYRYDPETPSIDEGLPGGTEVTHLLVTLRDDVSYSNLRLTEDGGGRFALDAETGLITTTGSLNSETDPASYRLTVAVDTEEGTLLQYVNIILNETNLGPTAVHLSSTLATVAEDADTSSRTRVATIEITDDGVGTNIVSLAGADADQFEVVGDSLYLKADRTLDYETQASYSVTVSARDSSVAGSNPVTAAMTLGITDANDAPSAVAFTNAVNVISDRTDTASAVKIADILVMDDALGSNALTLSGADADSFEVVGTELYLRAGTALDTDVQSSYAVTVIASDSSLSGSTPVTTSFTLAVSEVNFAPTAVHLSDTLAAVAEDADTSSRTRVAHIAITDDGAGTNIVRLAGADADQFEVVGDSLYLKANRTLDYETQASYSVTVRVADSAIGNPVTAAMTLGITDANDAPAGVSLVNAISSLSDETDTANRVKVADIHITDDALGSNAISLSGADADSFEIIGTALYLRAGTALDTDVQSSYAVTVLASDSSLSGSTPITTELNLEVTPPGSGNMVIETYDFDVGNNLLSGGSFDNIPVSGRLWNQHRLGFVSSIPGWSHANRIEVWGQSFLTRIFGERAGTEDRGRVLELDNASSGGVDWIQQGIATEQGVQYRILIDVLGRTGNGASDDLQLRWNNNTFHTATTAEMRGQSWQTLGGLVTGTGGTNTLRISETASGNDGVGPLIDNVRAYRYEPETPSVDEGLPGGTEVTHLLVTLLDGASYSNLRLAEDGGGRFALDAETGLITTTGSLNYDADPASYRLTVAVDTEEATQLQYVNIILNETNQGPTAVHLSSTLTAVAEDADTSSRTRVAHIAITDDGAGTNIVRLTGADADQFEVVGDSLYLKADRTLDYETQASYSVTVSVEDSSVAGSNPVTAAMTLGITDANDAPSAVALTNAVNVISDRTDTSSAVKVADIVITDDTLGSNTLALSGADAAHFEVVGTALYLRAGTALDTDVQSSYAVTVLASDNSLLATPVTTELTLEVTPPGSGNMMIETYDVGNNLVSGGSFDNIPVSGRLWNQHRLGFVPSIPGWSSAHPIEVWGQSFLTRIFGERAGTEDRGQVLELDNEFHNGNQVRRRGVDWIQQGIDTEQGAQYLILIDALGRTGNGASDDLQLLWNNNTFHTATTAEMRGQSWQTFSGLVTGTGGTNTLRISETASGNDGVGPLIDNVRAYRAEPETPSIDEGLPGGTEVTHLLVTLLDGASYSNLRLAEDGGGRFALDAETGLITTTGSLTSDTDPASYRLTVAVDTEEGTQLQYVNIILNETNQGPTAVHLRSTLAAVAEDADTSSRTRVAHIAITDDGVGTNTVSLIGADADQFEVVGDSLYLKADRTLDYETQASYSVTVSARDSSVAGSPVVTDLSLLVDELDDILDVLAEDWAQSLSDDANDS